MEDTNILNVAVDVGYGYVKAMTDNNKRVIFPTLIGNGVDSDFGSMFSRENNIKNMHVDYKNESFFVGEMAMNSKNQSRIFEQKRYDSEHFKLILNVAIQLLTEGKTSNVNLTTGLPLSFFSSQQKELRESLKGLQPTIKWKQGTLAGQSLTTNINDVIVFPQGASAIHSALADSKGKFIHPELMLSGNLLGLIDIGYRTTDFVVVEVKENGALEPKEILSSTIDNIGVHSLMHSIKTRFKAESNGADLSEYHLSRLLQRGFIKHAGKKIDFTDFIEESKHNLASSIAESLKSNWAEESNFFDGIFLAGGGGMLFEDSLQQHFQNELILIEENQFANAIGYKRWGDVYFNRK